MRLCEAHDVRRTPKVVVASIAGLLVLGAPTGATAPRGSLAPVPSPSATFAHLVQQVGGGGDASTAARYRYLDKLDSHLQDVAVGALDSGAAGASAAAQRQGLSLAPGGDVPVDVYVDGDVAAAAKALRAIGMQVTATSDQEPQRMVEGLIAPDLLAQAATLGSTHAVLSIAAATATGSVTSQGDAAIDGPAARALGPTGAGVRVGIISDSIDEVGGGIAASQATGDLPPDVHDLLEPAGGTDEGRAMAEIVYDEAPGISGIDFSTGFIGPATKAASIDNLVAAGDKVIADDIFYRGEPFFQDDVISAAVDRAKAAGTAYLAIAGNESDNSWQGAYAPVPDPSSMSATTEDFEPGAGVSTLQGLGTIPEGDEASISLEWAEPWGHATDDFALDVYSITAGVPTYAFTVDSNNIASGIPLEFARVDAINGDVQVAIAIRHVAGTGTPLLKVIDFTNGAFPVTFQFPNPAGAIAADAGSAAGALTVAASEYSTPTTAETYSSKGPVTHYFALDGTPLTVPEVLQKPDIAAPDGVATSLSGFSPFSGTSAAAPAAAGIAALIRSAKPAMPVDEVYAIMTDPANALGCGVPGDCGAGFDLADRAVAMAQDPSPPVITPSVSPPTPDGPNGWYHEPVTVSFSVSDPQSPVVDVTGCDPTSVGDTAGPVTCSATSAGGTTSLPVAIKRDTTPPTAPVISGIAAQTYLDSTVPPASAIACSATDPTSGIDSCTVTGYDATIGVHRLTAVATDDAGLTSTSTLDYAVTATPAVQVQQPVDTGALPPARPIVAISALALGVTPSLAHLERSGLAFTLHVATPTTQLVMQLEAMLGHPARRVVLGRRTRTAGAGTAHVSVQLSAAAKRRLKGRKKLALIVHVYGLAATGASASLQRGVVVR